MSRLTLQNPSPRSRGPMKGGLLVACPDSRPPAYQAVIGLERAGLLGRFVTGFYYRGDDAASLMGRRLFPGQFRRVDRALRRRHHPEIPARKVKTAWSFDLALALENRSARLRAHTACWRTQQFDRGLAREVARTRPDALLVFSDVGSEFTIPRCRELGIPVILSVVHGEFHEEIAVLEREARTAPEFLPIYLGDGRLDRDELAWLHERRRRDAAGADLILVPSEHIASAYVRQGTPHGRLRVIPYAADTGRFTPDSEKQHGSECRFLFTGGITQRKGIGYLLQAWKRVQRPGWRLQLLGELPRNAGPLSSLLEGVEVLGRLPHAEVAGIMAQADVFVFPSLFEGSAVVTYEALACGLPSIVTAAAGSVVRDGIEGLVVPPADIDALATAMERLGQDPSQRATFATAARSRAESFDWARYHASLVAAIETLDGSIR